MTDTKHETKLKASEAQDNRQWVDMGDMIYDASAGGDAVVCLSPLCGGYEVPESWWASNKPLILASPKLLAALKALSGLEVKGHPLLARLQFSEEGRKLAAQVNAAIAEATDDSIGRAV